MSVQKDDGDDLAAALQRVQQRGLGAKASRGPTSFREAEAAIVNLAMVVLWPRRAAPRGDSKAAEKAFKAAIIDELRGETKLAQLLRALYGVDEFELSPIWAAYRAFVAAQKAGHTIADKAYAAAAAQMEQPDAAGRKKAVKPGTVKRNVIFARKASEGKSVAWMFGGTPPQRPKKSKAASSVASVSKGKSRSR